MVGVPSFIRAERVRFLKPQQTSASGDYVLYVMEACQRTVQNYALEYAVYQANGLSKPLVVLFPLLERQPHPNLRRFRFMLEGLAELRYALRRRNIKLVVRKGSRFSDLMREARLIVLDRAYLSHQREFRSVVVEESEAPVAEVEGGVVCPVEAVSQKAEPYARTIRPKLLKILDRFLEDLPAQQAVKSSLPLDLESWDEDGPEEYLRGLDIDRSVQPVSYFRGGEEEGLRRLSLFVRERLPIYAEKRSDPGTDATSELSPYLRFGMVSPVQVLKAVLRVSSTNDANVQSLVNELVVWRELARNAAVYNPLFGGFDGLPGWARQTLIQHVGDRREYVYDLPTLERAETHDPFWNAAQRELLATGKIHNYVRMYWCKKLIEWTETPQRAFEYAVYLNDRYGLDGLDPNSYLGISWCFGAFDRPFFESKIYGKVRRMTEESLKRKPGIQLYLSRYS
ncbi:MAG: deoxyribodipyrimidine photo-lyase [Aigarchaeota archaeon]|nr:deoxyribodipyrimidine photo-lyase [Candidatus Calditenuaceae archaeon]